MDKDEHIKFEFFTWKKISHGLFDYDNKNCCQTNIKVPIETQVFIRAGDTIKCFKSFGEACKFKEDEGKNYKPGEGDSGGCSFLIWGIKDK